MAPQQAGQENQLKLLLHSLSGGEPPSKSDVEIIAHGLGSSNSSVTSLATLCVLQSCTKGVNDTNIDLPDSFRAYVQHTFLAEGDVDPAHLVPCTNLLGSLFAHAPKAAIGLLHTPIGNQDEGTVDVFAILLEAAELPSTLQPALAEMLGQAASSKAGRELVEARATQWLRGAIAMAGNGGSSSELGVSCAVALSKLGRPELSPDTGAVDTVDEGQKLAEEVVLCKTMMEHIKATSPGPHSSTLYSTLQGLSVLSLKAPLRHVLITDKVFLKAFLDLSPTTKLRPSSLPLTPRGSMDLEEKLFEPVERSLCYALTMILVNMTSPKPVLSAEDAQVAQLREMAISGKKGGGEIKEDPFESDEAVKQRVDALITAGIVESLSGLIRAESGLVKDGLGRLCRNLVEDKANRSTFIRDGGFKVLTNTIRYLLQPPKETTSSASSASLTVTPDAQFDPLPAIQALAKLVITSPPHLLFPPPHATTALNALTPLYTLLVHPKSTMLQNFEALMALTNIASIDSSIADRIVSASIKPPDQDSMWRGSGREDALSVLSKIEEMMFEQNPLVRRAATELVCNLVGSEKGFNAFTGENGSTSEAKVKSRLNVLLVLTMVDDLQTRLAAGGALAVLTESPAACESVLTLPFGKAEGSTSARSPWARVISLLDPEDATQPADDEEEAIPVISTSLPNSDLVHRGVAVLYNLINFAVESKTKGKGDQWLEAARTAVIEDKLMEVVRREKRMEILPPAVEALKLLKANPAAKSG
jgi:hypothetical protein